MLDYRNLLLIAVGSLLLTGCGAILNANFENNKYQSGASPAGLIPGGPSGDRINVTGDTIGIHVNSSATPNITAVTGDKSLTLGFATGIGFEVENGIVYFSSKAVGSMDSRFTMFWAGKKYANDSAITCNIGGIDSGIPDRRLSFGVGVFAQFAWYF